jgi:hypothetical protein
MSQKILRKLFNHYNNIFEVTFDDGSIVEGTYKVQISEGKHNSPSTSANFVITAFPDMNKCSDVAKINDASSAIEMHIKDRIKKIVFENF